jgi:putative flippase GtrA
MLTLIKNLKNKKVLYLITGGINTLFSFFSGIFLFYFLLKDQSVALISLINSFISISFSFATYKFIVFKSKNPWFYEYVRAYLIYGASSILSIAFLIILVDYLNIKFWEAQFFIIPITILFSYLGHLKFTFRKVK